MRIARALLLALFLLLIASDARSAAPLSLSAGGSPEICPVGVELPAGADHSEPAPGA